MGFSQRIIYNGIILKGNDQAFNLVGEKMFVFAPLIYECMLVLLLNYSLEFSGL